MKRLSDTKEKIILRRSRVIELHSKGMSENQMARELNVARTTINSDIRVMINQAFTKIESFEKRVPYEFDSMIYGVKRLLVYAWSILESEQSSEKAVANAMLVVLSCYKQLRELQMDKTDIQEVLPHFTERKESRLESWRDRQMREAYEAERYRQERIF
jgi:orotate phosphoribosyltransferase-like protein